jgi:hypothetical protein
MPTIWLGEHICDLQARGAVTNERHGEVRLGMGQGLSSGKYLLNQHQYLTSSSNSVRLQRELGTFGHPNRTLQIQNG